MIKRLSCIALSIIWIFVGCLTVQAVTATAILTPSSSTVKAGDIFTVTLSVNCADGINGATGITYNYDTSVLQLLDSGVNDTNFMNIGTTTTIDLISNSSTKITKSNIYVFNFKVKEDATVGKKATISINAFSVDSDIQGDSETTVEANSVTVKVASNESNERPKDNEGLGTKNSTTPSQTEVSSLEDKDAVTSTDDKKNISTTKSNTQNTALSNKELPKTGLIKGIGCLIVLIIAISVFYYIKCKKIDI